MGLRILWLSDRMVGGHSAYTKVTYECCTRLHDLGYRVAHLPMGQANKMGKQDCKGVLVYESGAHAFGEDKAIEDYVDWNSDILIVLKETWALNHIHRFAINLVPYCPIDHSPVSPSITMRLHTAFKVLTPSRHGQRELRRAGIDNVEYMPHGVPTDRFRPLEDQAAARKKFFLEKDDFVLLYVGWSRARKMIPHQLRGYKRFTELNPDVKSHFMLWTNTQPTATPEEMPLGMADTSVSLLPEMAHLDVMRPPNDVRYPDWKEYQKIGGLPDVDPVGGQDLVSLYNCADVVSGVTGGEGAWLVGLEAQACGKPIIVTDYASAPEIVGAGIAIPPNRNGPWPDYVVLNTPGTRYAIPDIDKMAEALTKIMNADPAKLARRARRFAMRYDWREVIDRYWKPFLEDCETELFPHISKEGVRSWS